MVNIYDYTNYRLFLKDFLAEQKRNRRPEFAHKVILDRLGVSSTGFVSNVISGRKNLTPIHVSRLSKALRLNQIESAYFESMVHFTQARTVAEKDEFLERMITVQKVKLKVLDKKKLTIFSKWYYVFVREALNFVAYKDDAEAFGRLFDPPIKPAEVQEAIEFLEQLGLITKDQDGYYRQMDAAITSGDEVRSLDLAKFQLATMDLAKRALERVPTAERDISVLTMTLSSEAFAMVKSELQAFRKRLAEIAINDAHPERVFQVNLQFFPVTRRQGERNETR